jgi:uncharacterized protein with NRDE domain
MFQQYVVHMCLILFAYDIHPHYRLVLAANRDEFYERPAAPLHFWEDHPEVLAGRDLRLMGTWLGVTRSGRLAALTNYRDPRGIKEGAPSRGNLVADFLQGNLGPSEYLQKIEAEVDAYNGFNIIVGDRDDLYYGSNRGVWLRKLRPGFYGLSNHLLDTPWPKVRSGLARFKSLVTTQKMDLLAELEDLLKNQEMPPDEDLPDTGVGQAWERRLAPIFISSPSYGTRCSSLLTIARTGRILFREISWDQVQESPHIGIVHESNFTLD